MSEIIRGWLTKSMGIILDYDLISFGEITRDGKLVADVLYSYGVIDGQQYAAIVPGNCNDNLRLIRLYLKRINVDLTDKTVQCVAKGEGSAAVRLFYQLYHALNSKNKLYYLVERQIEAEPECVSVQPIETKLSIIPAPNRSTIQVIEWHKQLEAPQSVISEPIVSVQPPPTTIRTDSVQGKSMRLQMHRMVLAELLEGFAQKHADQFNRCVTEKLLKQSVCEKRTVTKLFDIWNHRNLFIENRITANRLWNDSRLTEFIESVYGADRVNAEGLRRFVSEKRRLAELHDCIYAERLNRKYRLDYEACGDIMRDVVQLVLKSIEYTEYFSIELPRFVWEQWKRLFVLGEPICDEPDALDVLLDEPDDADQLNRSVYRQQCLDEKDLEDYVQLECAWDLRPDGFDDTALADMDAGNNVLGYVVHRLLLYKYPLPVIEPPKDLPETENRVCVYGVREPAFLLTMRELLRRKEILCFDVPAALDFCLKSYSNETTREIDEKLTEETKKAKGKGKKPAKVAEKIKKGKKSKSGKQTTKVVVPESSNVDVGTQTPRIYPCEEIQLTTRAELGKTAFETLNLGVPLTDAHILSMIIEFLRYHKNVKGFVLVNYPDTIQEAIELEEAMTSCQVTFRDQLDDTQDLRHIIRRNDLFTNPTDPYEVKRVSKLLPNLIPTSLNILQQSYFTTTINFKTTSASFAVDNDLLDRFYTKYSTNLMVKYDKFDADTITNLVKVITKDDGFAEVIRAELAEKLKKKSKQKTKVGKKKVVVPPEPEVPPEVPQTDIPIELDDEVVEVVPPKPGEVGWEYVDKPLPEMYKYLADMWESTEEIYINDFRELFFLTRIYQNSVNPYVRDVDNHMEQYINRPDLRQQYLYDFQKIYNDLEVDLREDDEFKAELHCRIHEFRSKLWELCDRKMRESETERMRIINNNWFANQSVDLLNLYITSIQLELDRSLTTFQLLQDYYTGLLSDPVDNKLPRYSLSTFDKRPKPPNQFEAITNLISSKYVNTTFFDNPYSDFLKNTLSTSLNRAQSWYNSVITTFKKVEAGTKQSPKPKRKEKPKKIAVEVKVDESLQRTLDEWSVALRGELLRVKFRLNLIALRARNHLEELLGTGSNLFAGIYARVRDRYEKEVRCVDSVCVVLGRAVEACVPIQPQLVLDGADFYVDTTCLMYPDELVPTEPLGEVGGKLVFTVSQLEGLVDILTRIAPSGWLPTIAFTHLLTDLVVNRDEASTTLPSQWYYLKQGDVCQLVRELFGIVEVVDWKDFLILNLGLPFPTELELLEARKQFRTLDPERTELTTLPKFMSVRFWFDYDDLDDGTRLRFEAIKKLVCRMFRVGDTVNYSRLLLYFCRDKDPVVGFAKALELSIGNLVCWNQETGAEYAEAMRYQKYLKDQERCDTVSMVESVLSSLVANTTSRGSVGNSAELNPSDASLVFEENCSESYGEEVGYIPYTIPLCFFVSLEVLLTVLANSLPWYFRSTVYQDDNYRLKLERAYDRCRSLEFDGLVFVHEILQDDDLKEIYHTNNKFLVGCPQRIVKDLVEVCTCRYVDE